MILLEFDIVNADKLQFLLGTLSVTTKREISQAIQESLAVVTNDAIHLVPVDTGKLRQSIRAYPSGMRGEVRVNSNYGKDVEEGRPPGGSIKDTMREVDGWSRRHGIPTFLVARSIVQKGTKPHPFLAPAVEANEAWIKRRFREALDNVLSVVVK